MIDITMDADGRPSVVYQDNNNAFARDTASSNQQGGPHVMFAKIANGPSLLLGHGPYNLTYPTDFRSSPAGDATWPNHLTGAANLPSLDVLGAGAFVSGQQLKGRIDLADASTAGMTRDLAAYNAARGVDLPAQRLQYVVRFATAKDVYYMAFDTDGAGVTRAYGGKLDATSAISNGSSNVGTTYDPQAAYPVTAEVQGKSLVFTAPLSEFGVARGSTLYSLTGFAIAGPSNTSLVAANLDATIVGIDRVVDASPPLDAVLGTSTLDQAGNGGPGANAGGGGGTPNTSSGLPLWPAVPAVPAVPAAPPVAGSPPRPARNSAKSRTLAASASALAVHAGSPASSWPYSFIAEPQPAELTTIASTPAASNVAIVRLASRSASGRRPECSDSAPQHPCPFGMTMSHPSAARTRAVAVLTWGKKTPCTQPVSIPTTARRGPRAGTRPGSAGTRPCCGGASRSAASSSGENRPGRLLRWIS